MIRQDARPAKRKKSSHPSRVDYSEFSGAAPDCLPNGRFLESIANGANRDRLEAYPTFLQSCTFLKVTCQLIFQRLLSLCEFDR